MDFLQNLATQFIQEIQTLHPVLDDLARFFSFLGTAQFYLLSLSIIYWSIDRRIGRNAFLGLIATAFLGLVLGQLLHQPRPYWLGLVQPLALDATYGVPSLAAANSMLVLGYLTYRFNKPWLWASSGICIFMIAFSRLYLGVQYPWGILAGWLLGFVILAALIKFERLTLFTWSGASRVRKVAVSFGFSILMILIGLAVGRLITSTPDPLAWVGFATGGRLMSFYFIYAGALFGVVSACTLVETQADFQIPGFLHQKIACCLFGLVGILLIYSSLEYVYGEFVLPETITAYVLRYFQAGLITFWVLFFVPYGFIRAKFVRLNHIAHRGV